MLLKKYKIIEGIKFIRSSNIMDHMCYGNCKLYAKFHQNCYFVHIQEHWSLQYLCERANKYLEDNYIPLDYVIKKV